MSFGLRIDPQALWTRQNITLALMLLGLHFALMLDLGSGASRALLLTHLGLFLLWQPVWQGTQRLEPGRATLLLAGGAVLVWWNSWWLIALWLAVLFSLIGGNVPAMRTSRERFASLLAALYLLAMLLVWVVPKLFAAAEFSNLAVATIRYGLVLPLVAIPFLHAEVRRDRPRYAIDLVYSVLLFLLVVVLVLGAFFVQQVSHGDYPIALAKTLTAIAALMLILSWLWDPRGGFAGIGQLLSRYFLSLGMPFERWMHSLANLAEQESDPDRFLAQAVAEMVELPWLSGIEWSSGSREGSAGVASGTGTAFTFGALTLRLYTKWRPSPALTLHMRLLARLLADYHEAKVREEVQRRTAYLQAIYETGSRLTHDVKNLLQSLRSLCSAAETSGSSDAEALRRLIQRQLPQITQRLQSTLDKLDARRPARVERVAAAEWWRALAQRYAHEGVEFATVRLPPTAQLPGELFDSVADNLLQNALEKRRRGETHRIEAALKCDSSGCRLAISDAGAPIPEPMARQFFTAPVPSDSGLGVGLYQSARHAAELGFALRLDTNAQGAVRFVLESTSSLETAA
ncbi:MAG: hypothetical protein K2X67_15295 [Burkholderiales bacterium]|nr:hypothetical protein [Burkholderiales bacterium]